MRADLLQRLTINKEDTGLRPDDRTGPMAPRTKNEAPEARPGATGAEFKADQLRPRYAPKAPLLATFYWHPQAHSVERLPAFREMLG